MLLANIVPVSLLHYLPTNSNAAFLALSNLVDISGYASFYRRQAERGRLVILDNPVHEDIPFDVTQWREAIQSVTPSVIVLPDVIDGPNETVQLAREFSRWALELAPRKQLMVVPHGETDEEFLECAKKLRRFGGSGVTWFGVSLERRLNDDDLAFKRRTSRISRLVRDPETRGMKIHLLGLSERAAELDDIFFQDTCYSVDTSKFAVWHLRGTPVNPPLPIERVYPGRSAFGGSMQYFYCMPSSHRIEGLGDNLSAWCAYADRREVH